MSFASFLQSVVSQLDAAGIPYMATGGVALLAYGEPRFTADADIVIAPSPPTLETFLAKLDRNWYASREAAGEALARTGMFNVVETTTGWKADLIVAPTDEFASLAFSRRRVISALGVSLFGISPEDLIVSKLRWAAAGDSEKQLRDAAGILAVQRGALDEEYLRRAASSAGVRDSVEELLRGSRSS